MAEPLNLMELYGERYQVGLEPGTFWRRGMVPDPWTYQLLCKHGHFYPYSDERLGYYCDGRIVMRRLIQEQPQIELAQEGDFEAVFLFNSDQFDTVAEYAKPRRKRRLSKAARARLAKVGYNTRFLALKHGTHAPKTGQFRTKKSNET